MDRQRSEARIAEVIAESSVDIVGLQELDLGRRRSAGVDQTRIIAEQLGWHSHFHPAMRRNDEQYGNAILSRYQLSLRRAIELPGRPPFFCRENRAAIEVEIGTNLGKVHVINTHLGLGWRERVLQAQLFTSAEGRAATASDIPLIYSVTSIVCAVRDHIARLLDACAMPANLLRRRDPFALFRRDFRCSLSIIFLSAGRSSR